MRTDSLLLHNDFYSLAEPTNRKHAPWLELGAAFIGFLTSFVDAHIWSPGSTYYCVIGLVMADFVTGVLVGVKNPIGFETRKMKKLPMSLVCYTGIMLLANKFSAEPSLFWLPQTVLAPIVVINLISLIKNCSLLDWLPEQVAKWLYKNIDKYKNPNRNESDNHSDPYHENDSLVAAESDRHLVSH